MIYFLTPDDQRPWGGIKMIYEYASLLEASGVPARVWHGSEGFRCTWFRSDARVVNALELKLARGDVLVVPEDKSEQWTLLCAGVPNVVLNQNHFNMFGATSSSSSQRGGYPGSPETVGVIATSRAIEGLVRALVPATMPVHHVPVVLDLELFSPLRKERIISWMPRKRERQVSVALNSLKHRGNLGAWSFRPIDGVSAQETASILGRSAIFILGGENEGLGLPGLEAMSAGAHVIGFLGGGGSEYASAPLCVPVQDGEVLDMVRSVEAAARRFDLHPDRGQEHTGRTREWIAATYGRDIVAERLRDVAVELTASGSLARVEGPATIRHLEVAAVEARAIENSPRRRLGRGLRAAGLRR